MMMGNELTELETRVFEGRWSEAKENAILARYEKYIVQNAITNIAIKIPPLIPKDSPLEQVLQKVLALASRYGCKTMLVTREDLKNHARLHHLDSLVEYAVLQYPLLRAKYIKEKESITHYHTKMFEAVVAAELCKGAVRK